MLYSLLVLSSAASAAVTASKSMHMHHLGHSLTVVPVQTVRTYNVITASQPTITNQLNQTVVKMVPFNQPSSGGFTSNTSVSSSYSVPSNTNVPPPYCEAKH